MSLRAQDDDSGARAPAIGLVAAITDRWVIGSGNRLPWHLPEDLRRFRSLTLDGTIVMGRRTFDSIGRPLPRRRSIVISRSSPRLPAGVLLAGSLQEALEQCRGEPRVFVIGGGEIFREALPLADCIHLTVIYAGTEQPSLFEPLPGDAFFPPLAPAEWGIRKLGPRRAAGRARGLYYRFIDLERTAAAGSGPLADGAPFDPARFARTSTRKSAPRAAESR